MSRATLRIFLLGAGLGVVFVIAHLALMQVQRIGVQSYFGILMLLDPLEKLGLPTLKGSPDGWPVPTRFGFVVSFFVWWLLYFAISSALILLVRRLVRHAHQSV
jgi:hypothetical protein